MVLNSAPAQLPGLGRSGRRGGRECLVQRMLFRPATAWNKGVARKLVKSAVVHAREKGATVVEAYPVAPDSPSYRFMWFIGTFESMGFREVGRAGIRRHVMRLPV